MLNAACRSFTTLSARLNKRASLTLYPELAVGPSLPPKAIWRAPKRRMAAYVATSEAKAQDPLVQYVALRKDVVFDWPVGAVAAQAAHAATAALWLSREATNTSQYCAPENIDHMRKVVLEATDEAQLLQIAAKLEEAGIQHKLWIEQPENVPTALAAAPNRKSVVGPFFKKLKLCGSSIRNLK